MDEATAILKYIELLVVTFIISTLKTLIYRLQYNVMMNDIFCIELVITIIMTQAYLIYARRHGYFDDEHIVKVILVNIIFTTIAWGFGTAEGVRGLCGTPNIYR